MKTLRLFSILILVFAFSLNSFGWGMDGHRIVGEIADRHLTAKAKKNIRKILGNESIAMSSNWADFIKSNPTFDSLDKSHYINFKSGLSRNEFDNFLQNNKDQNAYNSILFLSNELKSGKLNDSLKVMYLKLLIHFVGDVHQPLHTGRPEDLGGNKVRVNWFNNNINIHSLWDSYLIEYQKLSYTEYVNWINHASKEQKKLWMNEPIENWLWESYVVTEKIYAETPENANLKYKYNYDFIDVMNLQLLKGGIRLAGMLNSIFG